MKALCVYCGSAPGATAEYANAALLLASALVEHNLELVYGGGNIGLMGILANEVMRLGGEVTGVIPQLLMDREVGHMALTRLHIVKDMHERKALMAELSDGFIALPGGIGTLEELFEMLTWRQIGFHNKPVALLNVNGFYDGLLGFLNFQVEQKFLRPAHRALLLESNDADDLIHQIKTNRK
ncbi:uncharacterized protein (TIGR00730 family) [Oxalobacteraceae bacterium GrIS 2.11]